MTTAATRIVPVLALAALVAAACTVNVGVDPSAGLDSVGGADDVLDDTFESALNPDLSGDDPLAAAQEAVDGILDAAAGLEGSGLGDGASLAGAPDGAGASPESPLILAMPPPAGDTPADDPRSTPSAASAATEGAAEDPSIAAGPAPGSVAGPAGDADPDATTPGTDPPSPSATEMIPVDDLESPAPEDLPGDPYEYGPDAGDSLAVVGVDYDDVLNVRDVPFGEITATLGVGHPRAYLLEVRGMPSDEPIAWFDSWDGAITATGRTRKLSTTVWHEVRVAGVTGWASGAYLAPIGLGEDVTERLIEILGRRPVADTLIDLAMLAVEALTAPEPPTRVVVTTAPGVFEAIGEVTVDVLNLPDDSLLGYRLYISADAGDDWMSEDPGPFTLRTAAQTILCRTHRGVTADGLCN